MATCVWKRRCGATEKCILLISLTEVTSSAERLFVRKENERRARVTKPHRVLYKYTGRGAASAAPSALGAVLPSRRARALALRFGVVRTLSVPFSQLYALHESSFARCNSTATSAGCHQRATRTPQYEQQRHTTHSARAQRSHNDHNTRARMSQRVVPNQSRCTLRPVAVKPRALFACCA